MCLVFRKCKGKEKKMWKVIFLSLCDMKNMIEKKYIKENTKENIVIFFLLFSLKISEENKREGKDGGNFIKLALSSLPSLQFTYLPLHQRLWLPTTIGPFNGHNHYSDHLPVPPKTNPLMVHKFP